MISINDNNLTRRRYEKMTFGASFKIQEISYNNKTACWMSDISVNSC